MKKVLVSIVFLQSCLNQDKVKAKEIIVHEQLYLKSAIKTHEVLLNLHVDRQRFSTMNLSLPKEIMNPSYLPMPLEQYRDTIRKYEAAIQKFHAKYDSLEMELKKY